MSTEPRELFQPTNALWWLYVLLCMVATADLLILAAPGVNAIHNALWAVLLLVAASGALVGYIINKLDLYRSGRVWVQLCGLGGGATIAAWISIHANQAIQRVQMAIFSDDTTATIGPSTSAPITEEWSKGLVILLLLLLAAPSMQRPMHGLLLGTFTGLGFQLTENILYATNAAQLDIGASANSAITVTITRLILGFASHWVLSGIVGVGIAVLLGRGTQHWQQARRITFGAGLILLAVALHALWNLPEFGLFPILTIAKTVLLLIVFAAVVRWAWEQERAWLWAFATQTQAPLGSAEQHTALGTYKQRRAVRAQARREGRSQAQTLRTQQQQYLQALQAATRQQQN